MVISAPAFYSWTEVALLESQFQNKQTNSFGSSLQGHSPFITVIFLLSNEQQTVLYKCSEINTEVSKQIKHSNKTNSSKKKTILYENKNIQ